MPLLYYNTILRDKGTYGSLKIPVGDCRPPTTPCTLINMKINL